MPRGGSGHRLGALRVGGKGRPEECDARSHDSAPQIPGGGRCAVMRRKRIHTHILHNPQEPCQTPQNPLPPAAQHDGCWWPHPLLAALCRGAFLPGGGHCRAPAQAAKRVVARWTTSDVCIAPRVAGAGANNRASTQDVNRGGRRGVHEATGRGRMNCARPPGAPPIFLRVNQPINWPHPSKERWAAEVNRWRAHAVASKRRLTPAAARSPWRLQAEGVAPAATGRRRWGRAPGVCVCGGVP